MPVATLKAISSPSHVLEHFGHTADHADRVGAPQFLHKPALGVLLSLDLTHAHDRKQWTRSHGQFHALTFFRNGGRGWLG